MDAENNNGKADRQRLSDQPRALSEATLGSLARKILAAGSVSRILSALRRDGHSSGLRITARLKRPTRRLWRAEPARVPGAARRLYREFPPYLVLLRVGFALPAALLPRRCALTAPFHPYLSLAARAVCFLWHFPSSFPLLRKERARMGHPPGRYPAHCSAEFGLSSALRQRPSDPAANRVIIEQGSKMPLKWTEWRGSYPSRELSWSCLLSGFAPQSSPVRTPRFPRRDNSSSSGW